MRELPSTSMSTKDEALRYSSTPPKLSEDTEVQAQKVGFEPTSAQLRSSGRSRVALRLRTEIVSSKVQAM